MKYFIELTAQDYDPNAKYSFYAREKDAVVYKKQLVINIISIKMIEEELFSTMIEGIWNNFLHENPY